MNFKVTKLDCDDLYRAGDLKEIPQLTSVKSCVPVLSEVLTRVNTLVKEANSGNKEAAQELVVLTEKLLTSGHMTFVEVSKVEVCTIYAKCQQIVEGIPFKDAMDYIIATSFNKVKI